MLSETPNTSPTRDPLYEFMRTIPKVELHCHLLGSVRHETFVELARRAGIRAVEKGETPPLTDAEADAFYIRGEKPVGVLKALRALDSHLLAQPADLHRITYEYLEDAARHHVRYAEFFWNPTGTAGKSGMAYPVAVDAIIAGIRDAARDHGITGRLVAAIDREAPPRAASEMVEWVVANPREEVIGIGIDYSEVNHPPEDFVDAYAAAKRAGLKATAHAGEFGMPWTNVQTAVEQLKVDRIDHGYTIVDAPEAERQRLVDTCRERGIVFTVVPTNSYYLRTLPPERWALDHPIRRMPGLGIAVHPNTDDPTMHRVTPAGAWLKMTRDFGFGIDDLRGFMLNGVESAWVDEGTKRAWRESFAKEFDALRAGHGA